MNILSAIIVFDILIILYEVIISFFSALYELAGLTKDEARFQVTSILTGTGFTTSESEKMLKTKKLKRITRDIMVISYIFNISIISTLIAVLTNTKNIDLSEVLIGIISIIIVILLLLSKRISYIRKKTDSFYLNLVKKIYKKVN